MSKDYSQLNATNHQLGDEVPLVSRLCATGQQHVVEHLDHDTGNYTVIHEGSHRITVTIGGVDDGGIYRFHCNGSTSYCYLKLNGMLV